MSHAEESNEILGTLVAERAPSTEAHVPFQELYARLGKLSERFIAARIHPRHVQDVHQETWQKAWKNAAGFRDQNSYRAWLLTIARHTITDTLRFHARRPEGSLQDSDDRIGEVVLPDSRLIDQEEQSALSNCLGQLSDRASDLVQGRLRGLSYAELCQHMSLSEPAAHKMFFNASRALQDCLKQKIP